MKNLFTVFICIFLTASVSAQPIQKEKAYSDAAVGYGLNLHFNDAAQHNFENIAGAEPQFKREVVSDVSANEPTERKDKKHAVLMSLLWPGLGQFYNGGTSEIIKGTLMAVGQATALVGLIDALNSSSDKFFGEVHEYRASIIAALMIGNIIYSMIDAGNVAEKINRRNGFTYTHEDLTRFALRDTYNIISLRVSL